MDLVEMRDRMNTMIAMSASEEKKTMNLAGKTRNEIWQDVIENIMDPTSGMDEAARKNYESKIEQKLKTGKKLTSEELDYLRIHNPELYRTAMRVELSRKALREQLKNCHSKEEVQQVVSLQMERLSAMKKEPDKQYMAAMINHEVETFKKSSDYARLPVKREAGKKQPKEWEWEKDADGQEEDFFGEISIYTRMQFQCDKITEIAQAFIE